MVDVIVGVLRVGLVIGLVVAWASVLLPPLTRLLGGVGRSTDSVGSFRNKMTVLGGSTPSFSSNGVLDLTSRGAGRPTPAATTTASTRASARKRRRDVLVGLLGANGVILLLALVVGGALWAVFALTFLALAGYVGLLWQMQQAALERQRKVAYFPSAEAAPAPQPALRRVGSGRV